MDEAGNESESSSGYQMVIDTVAPVVPTLEGAKLGKLSKPTLTGAAEPKSKVTIYKAFDPGEPVKDNILGQVSANKEGRYVFVPVEGFADGAHLIRATATDAAGNVSEASGLFSMKVDTAPPGVPVLTVESPTNESRPEIRVTAEAGSVVAVYSGDLELGEATENEDGVFRFVPEEAFADGFYVLRALATDEAGNAGERSVGVSLEVDTLAPIVPGSMVESPTNNNTPEITGYGEPGSMVVLSKDGEKMGQAMIAGDGRYSFVIDTELEDGSYLIGAKAVDAVSYTHLTLPTILLV